MRKKLLKVILHGHVACINQRVLVSQCNCMKGYENTKNDKPIGSFRIYKLALRECIISIRLKSYVARVVLPRALALEVIEECKTSRE